MRAGAAGLLALLGTAALSGCTKSLTTTPSTSVRYAEPRWESALQPTPALVLLVRPQALRRDAVYGPLIGRAIELAREHTPLVVATGALDAMEDADEVIVGARDKNQEGTDDLVAVVRGVRANVDPASLVDERGHAIWSSAPSVSGAGVRELLREPETEGQAGSEAPASLFELPGRTWVIATGEARARARDAFARPTPAVGTDPLGTLDSALAAVRVEGPNLVAHVRALRPPGLLAPLGSRLATVTVVLSPGDDALVRATLAYEDERAVALASATLREVIGALSRAKSHEYAWLRSVTVHESSCCVVLTAPLPRQLSNEKLLPKDSTGAAQPPGPTAEPPAGR